MNFKFPWQKKSTLDRLRAAQSQTMPSPLPVVVREPAPTAIPDFPEARVDAISATDRAAKVTDDRQAARQRALRDPLYLANEILGFQLQLEHAVLLEAMLDENCTDCLVMWPRGSGKTSCIAVAIVMNLIRNRNYTVRYLTSDIDVAKLRLSQIADCFDKPTDKFRALFPELVGLVNRRADEIIVEGRTDASLVDASVAVNTLRSLNTGTHANLIVLDDIVMDLDAQSEDYRDNNFARYQQIQGVRTGQLILSGTPYDNDDTLGRVQRAIDAEGSSTRWRKEVRGIWQHRCTTCTHKEIFHDEETHVCRLCGKAGHSCPQFQPGEKCPLIDRVETPSGKLGWTVDEILALQSPTRMGARVFATQMELDARPEAGLVLPVFTSEFLDQHTHQMSLRNFPVAFLVLDAALRASEPSADPLAHLSEPDASVLLAVTTAMGPAIPIDADAGQWNADTLARHIYEFMRRFPNAPLFTENIDAWPAIRALVERHAGGVALDIRTFPVAREANAKLLRIARLHTAMQTGRVKLYYDMPGIEVLRQQLRGKNYKSGGHDDFADSTSMIPLALDTMSAGIPLRGAAGTWSQPSDAEPSAAGDPLAWARWQREQEERGQDSGGSAGFLY